MSTRFTRAIVRKPGPTFAAGLTTAAEGAPELAKALGQHDRYCEALGRCGVSITTVPTDDRYPDGTFVEDTAVIAGQMAIVTWPGAWRNRADMDSPRFSTKSSWPAAGVSALPISPVSPG